MGIQNDNFNRRSFLYVTQGAPYGWGCGPDAVLAQEQTTLDNLWHTYRVEAQGNTIRLFIDKNLRFEKQDNRYRSGGQAGLWNVATQITVRSFKVIAL